MLITNSVSVRITFDELFSHKKHFHALVKRKQIKYTTERFQSCVYSRDLVTNG